MDEHPNATRVREALDAYNSGDLESMKEHLAEDILWHVGGDHSLSGDYHGRDDVVAYFEKVRSLTGGTITLEPIEILASDSHAGIFMRATADRGGQPLDTTAAEAIRFDGEGRWAEYWAMNEDQDAVDAFWKEGS
jgi:ketosteroid isomerase-like protein